VKHGTPRGKLTRDVILEAVLQIVDAEGLSAVSMRRVGEALGVEAMSLYNHVPSKAALLDGLYELVLSRAEPAPRAKTWMAHARHQGCALRAALAAHPNAIPLMAQRPAVTEAALLRLEANLAVLHDAGLSPLAALSVVQIVFAFVVGHTLRSLGPRSPDAAELPSYAALDPHVFPHVRAAALVLGEHDAEKEFEEGLSALVQGLSTSFVARARARSK
jgi:AcrR family transcriptional regulator